MLLIPKCNKRDTPIRFTMTGATTPWLRSTKRSQRSLSRPRLFSAPLATERYNRYVKSNGVWVHPCEWLVVSDSNDVISDVLVATTRLLSSCGTAVGMFCFEVLSVYLVPLCAHQSLISINSFRFIDFNFYHYNFFFSLPQIFSILCCFK